MPWIQRFTDNFNRANGVLQGAGWIVSGAGGCNIDTNKVKGGGAPFQFRASFATGTVLLSKQYAEADLNCTSATGSDFGVVLRSPGGTSRGYGFCWSPLSATLRIIRFVGGAISGLTGGAAGWAHPTGGTGSGKIRGEADGNLLSIYWNGVFIGSQTDTFYLDGGAGVLNTMHSSAFWGIDNFVAGDFVSNPWLTGKHNIGPKPNMRFR